MNNKRFLSVNFFLLFIAIVFSEKNSEEGKTGQAVIDDVDLKCLQDIVKFCHTFSLDEDDLTTDLMAAATKYKISEVVEHCEDHLTQTMSVDNPVDYFLAACHH